MGYVEEEDSLDEDSDEESHASQMERALKLIAEVVCMKKMQRMANDQIDVINIRRDINENNVIKKIRISAD